MCEAKADTLFHFTNVERLLSCSSGRLPPATATWVLVPGPLSVAGRLEIDEYRCLLGTGAEFLDWQRESLLEPGRGVGVWVVGGEGEREREEQLYYSLS